MVTLRSHNPHHHNVLPQQSDEVDTHVSSTPAAHQQAMNDSTRAPSVWSDSRAGSVVPESQGQAQPVPQLSDNSGSSVPRTPPEGLIPHLASTAAGETGFLLIDEALRDLRASRQALWIANSEDILKNCEWVPNGGIGGTFSLSWKPGSRAQPEDDSNEVIVCWIGEGSANANALAPDCGWKTTFLEVGLPKQKRVLRTLRPGLASRIPPSVWDSQLQGARSVIDNGSRSSPGAPKAGTGYLFLEEEPSALRVRSPVFLPLQQVKEDDEGDESSDSSESAMPASHCYDTWAFSSTEVREAFDRVKGDGFEPQVMEVYDHHDQLIHPNRVQHVVPGSIIIVFATLEKALFTGRKDTGGRKWQFYANLVKAQVLKQAERPKLAPKKRKVRGYGASGSSSAVA